MSTLYNTRQEGVTFFFGHFHEHWALANCSVINAVLRLKRLLTPVLKCHLENVIKKCFQNKLDKHKHNRANRNTFVSKTTVNSIIAIISRLMKEEISNLVGEAGIYSVQIDSAQDITSTDKCSVIPHLVRENVEE